MTLYLALDSSRRSRGQEKMETGSMDVKHDKKAKSLMCSAWNVIARASKEQRNCTLDFVDDLRLTTHGILAAIPVVNY